MKGFGEAWGVQYAAAGVLTPRLKRSLSLRPGTRNTTAFGACGARGVYSARSAVIGSTSRRTPSRAASTRGRLRPGRASSPCCSRASAGSSWRSQESGREDPDQSPGSE